MSSEVIQTNHGSHVSYKRSKSNNNVLCIIRDIYRRFPPKYIEHSFQATQSAFRSVEVNFKGVGVQNFYLFGHPRATFVFSN